MNRGRDGTNPLNRSRSGGTCDGGSSLPWVHGPRAMGVLESRIVLVNHRFISFKVNRATQVHVEIHVKVPHHPFLVLGPEEHHIVLAGHIVHVR